MATSLETRLAALERAIGDTTSSLVIFVRYVAPGQLDAPSVRAECNGVQFNRCNDESDDDFAERVKATVLTSGPSDRTRVVYLSAADQ